MILEVLEVLVTLEVLDVLVILDALEILVSLEILETPEQDCTQLKMSKTE